MTPELKHKFINLARDSVRPDKVEEMEALILEVEKAYESGELTKSYLTNTGMRIMALIKIECLADFIKHASELSKQVDIVPE